MTKDDLFYKNYLPNIKDEEIFDQYLSLIERFLESTEKIDYVEKHHIVPKCYLKDLSKKEKDKNNIVLLSAENHFLAHKLLFLSINDFFMTCAFKRMSESKGQNGDITFLTSTEYKNLKIKYIQHAKEHLIKDRQNNPDKYKEAHIKSVKNRHYKPLSEETKRKISESVSKTMTPEHRELLRQKSTGYKFTEEQRNNVSQFLINYHKEHPYSEETRKKISQSNKKSGASIECIETGEKLSILELSKRLGYTNRTKLRDKILNNEDINGLHYFFFRKHQSSKVSKEHIIK